MGALYNGSLKSVSMPNSLHVPTQGDWKNSHLGGFLVAGGKLKEVGTTHWINPNDGATNESGFTALPGGGYFSPFSRLGETGNFWSSTASDSNGCNIKVGVGTYTSSFTAAGWHWRAYFSVRCIKK